MALVDVGKFITPFTLNFYPDMNKSFLKDANSDFFNLEPNEFIINNLFLKLEEEPLVKKLTGKAAEIAKRKGLL